MNRKKVSLSLALFDHALTLTDATRLRALSTICCQGFVQLLFLFSHCASQSKLFLNCNVNFEEIVVIFFNNSVYTWVRHLHISANLCYILVLRTESI